MAKHNWTTNGTTVDRDVERATVAAICDCNHMTPTTVAEMDAKLGLGSSKSDVEPDPEVIDALNEDQGDWRNDKPGPEAFEHEIKPMR